jgi:hypothetical protein
MASAAKGGPTAADELVRRSRIDTIFVVSADFCVSLW